MCPSICVESSRGAHSVPGITSPSEVGLQTAGSPGQADQVLQCHQQPVSSDDLGLIPYCLSVNDALPSLPVTPGSHWKH